jgi:hypothetical protein
LANDARSEQTDRGQQALPEAAPGNSLHAKAVPRNSTAPEEKGPPTDANGLEAAADACSVARSDVSPICEAPLGEFRELGTLVRWADSVEQAAVTAQNQGKLLFVMHVSGNFELPGFT